MRSSEIRETFLNFFAERGHKVVPSSSLVPNDSTMLLTTAGMVQFKPIFLGAVTSDFSRATSCQKCLRTTDIELVGHTARHHTFFEMLGNFSFGDYYKREACAWAWELLTQHYRLDVSKMWVTIFTDDDEAEGIWRDEVGVAADRIVRLGEKDNFWSAGPTGPCGPCSEIVYDLGPERGCEKGDCMVGCDCDRWLEVWNLVFMQYDRDESGNLAPLPKKNIDTGAGLERIASILQGTRTNFETDQIRPIVETASELAGVAYGAGESTDISLRILADHARALAFMISDGVLPSNEGRGYVLRRLIRRAVRHGRLLGIEDAFVTKLVDVVIETMGGPYPDLAGHRELIHQVSSSEEERFGATLRQGLGILEEVMSEMKAKGTDEIGGEIAFRLYDTYGFPVELTREIASESGLSIDEAGFAARMESQRDRARVAREDQQVTVPAEALGAIHARSGVTDFVGYAEDGATATVVGLIVGNESVSSAEAGQDVEVILDRSPFYAEKGGQVGDRGTIAGPSGKVDVSDTKVPIEDLHVQVGSVTEGAISVGEKVEARIDEERRRAIRRNHTATHLLHWAMRLILGKHVKQAGSLVDADRLRFDFSHFGPVTRDELRRIETLANSKIFENHPVRAYTTSLEFARDSGAIALFGEKYGEFVRVLEIGNFSKELCGGTHVGRTSEIGLIRIVSEGSVGASLRRIEAVTGPDALAVTYDREDALEDAAGLLKVRGVEVPTRAASLLEELKKAQGELRQARAGTVSDQATSVLQEARSLDGLRVVIHEVDAASPDEMRDMVDVLRTKLVESGIIVLGGEAAGKALLIAAATRDVVDGGFDAVRLIRHVAPVIGGGGGGRPDMAQAGGKNPGAVPKALEEAWNWLKEAGPGA